MTVFALNLAEEAVDLHLSARSFANLAPVEHIVLDGDLFAQNTFAEPEKVPAPQRARRRVRKRARATSAAGAVLERAAVLDLTRLWRRGSKAWLPRRLFAF